MATAYAHALPQPKVTLKLTAEPANRAVKAGEVITYTILATNAGGAPALRVSPVGSVPARTEFVRIDRAPQATLEFSLDGSTWAEHPTIFHKDARGTFVRVPAPRSAYRAVRWTLKHPLAPKQSATFVYEVRVK